MSASVENRANGNLSVCVLPSFITLLKGVTNYAMDIYSTVGYGIERNHNSVSNHQGGTESEAPANSTDLSE